MYVFGDLIFIKGSEKPLKQVIEILKEISKQKLISEENVFLKISIKYKITIGIERLKADAGELNQEIPKASEIIERLVKLIQFEK